MRFDFENGIPVWVWGILFFLIILPFSFRPNSDTPQYGPNIMVDGQRAAPIETQPTPPPTPTVSPDATVPIVIDVAPPLVPEYPEPEEPPREDTIQGYE